MGKARRDLKKIKKKSAPHSLPGSRVEILFSGPTNSDSEPKFYLLALIPITPDISIPNVSKTFAEQWSKVEAVKYEICGKQRNRLGSSPKSEQVLKEEAFADKVAGKTTLSKSELRELAELNLASCQNDDLLSVWQGKIEIPFPDQHYQFFYSTGHGLKKLKAKQAQNLERKKAMAEYFARIDSRLKKKTRRGRKLIVPAGLERLFQEIKMEFSDRDQSIFESAYLKQTRSLGELADFYRITSGRVSQICGKIKNRILKPDRDDAENIRELFRDAQELPAQGRSKRAI